MDVIVRGRNIEVTDALKDHVTKKLTKLSKYFDKNQVTAQARLGVEKERHIVEVTIPIDGYLLRGEESGQDMYAAVDRVVDKLERQIDKFKKRVKPRRSGEGSKLVDEVPEPELVRKKTFPRKPMTVDEAMLQMDLLGHDFFAFTNAETETINVLYRRQDGNYGLLEPR